MKKLITLFCFTLFVTNVNCQTLPLTSFDEPLNGGFLKDIDNVLPFWETTWKGISNNKEYTFQFVKFPYHYSNFTKYYSDELLGKFKVVDLATNQVLYDDLAISNFEDFKIRLSAYGSTNGEYAFTYEDDEAHCYNSVGFDLIQNPSNPNQVSYKKFEYHELLFPDECTYPNRLSIPMFLPKQDMVLIRQ